MRSLGKVFRCSLKDTGFIKSTKSDLRGCLRTVDKSRLPGKFNLPRILWSLLIYEEPMMLVEGFE